MKKIAIGFALVLGTLVSNADSAQADQPTCQVWKVSERVSPAIDAGVQLKCTNTPRVFRVTSDAVRQQRFLSVILAGQLSGKSVWIDAGTCTGSICEALAWELQ